MALEFDGYYYEDSYKQNTEPWSFGDGLIGWQGDGIGNGNHLYTTGTTNHNLRLCNDNSAIIASDDPLFLLCFDTKNRLDKKRTAT